MWLLHFVPEWFVHVVLLASVVGLIASAAFGFIPFINRYTLPIKIVSVGLLLVSIWVEGVLSNQSYWQAKVKEAEAKAAIAEEKAKTASAKIEYKFIDRVKTVKDVQVIIQERVREVATKIDEQCKVAPEAIDLLNSAADNTTRGVDE